MTLGKQQVCIRQVAASCLTKNCCCCFSRLEAKPEAYIFPGFTSFQAGEVPTSSSELR